MSETYNSTDQSPETDDILLGAFRSLAKNINLDFASALPCIVTKISSDRTRVDVQPAISILGSSGEVYQRPVIYDLPVYNAGGGGFLISFPIAVGDLGWIQASDRDISLFLQSYSVEKPNSERLHDWGDSRFIPDIMRGFTIDGSDNEALVLQNLAGSVKISLNSDEIKIVAPAITLESAGLISLIGGGGVNINGAIAPASGGDIVSSTGVSLKNHYHEQGNDSRGDTEVATDTPTPTEI